MSKENEEGLFFTKSLGFFFSLSEFIKDYSVEHYDRSNDKLKKTWVRSDMEGCIITHWMAIPLNHTGNS